MCTIKQRKKSKSGICNYCKIQFLQLSYQDKQFCTNECFYKYQRSLRQKTTCIECNKEITISNYRYNRNKLFYCSRDCFNKRKSSSLVKIKRPTKYFRELVLKGCSCGIKDYHLLQIHHIDGNNKNNHPSNHEVVCANCHITRHLKLDKQGNLIYNSKVLTSLTIKEKYLSCQK